MKIRPGIIGPIGIGVLWLPLMAAALKPSAAADGQSFVGSGTLPGAEATGVVAHPASQALNNLSSNDPASKQCADGTRAIDQGRWADAVKIFTQVANQHSDHADGALYWRAYAENKLGQRDAAMKSCAELRAGFPKSRWIDDCGALEVELHAKSGEPVHIDPDQSDDLKLLALNTMLRQNEPLALAQIQEILNGDSSDKLKKEVQFILGTHYSDSTYAQIVRLSYVEGDVRIQRGEPSGKPSRAVWEKAAADIPLETGFSLATGSGRAEIEFENASTIYLGENSVLTFNDLHETAGIPFSELGLLSGTASLYFKPYVAGEKLILHTPTNDLVSRFPDKTYARVQAFTDAVAITPLEGGDVRLPSVQKEDVEPGQTWVWQQGRLEGVKQTQQTQEFSAWDEWVKDRVAGRAAQVSSVLEASGLTAPIPGMAEMAGQGKFFDCAPYGTCWEPKAEVAQDLAPDLAQDQETAAALRVFRPEQPRVRLAAYHPSGIAGQSVRGKSGDPVTFFDSDIAFPCTPWAVQTRMARNLATGQGSLVNTKSIAVPAYSWAVCHAGSWIHHRKHYVWVAGGKRHHIDPVRWVKSDHEIGFVPLHPYDVKDRPALNARHEVFVVSSKNPITLEPTKFDDAHPVEYLKAPPTEFAKVPLLPLTIAETPRMEAHPFLRPAAGQELNTARLSIPIRFDAKTQSFLVARQQTHGGSTRTVYAPISNRNGSLQAHSASFSGGSSFHGNSGSSSGFGSHGGSASSASHSGGGGASGSGGASHSGASGAGSVGSSSSAASSSGSSSHH
jgi:hypothetical protein